MTTQHLIGELTEITNQNIKNAIQLKEHGDEKLNFKQNPEKWSALECIEHLNRYGDFYIPEIKRRLSHATPAITQNFKPGLIGNYFAKIMRPGQKAMKTLKVMDPSKSANSGLRTDGLEEFIEQQKQMLVLLNDAKQYNLTKIKTSISISKLLKLRLGDTFRVVIYHNQRHMEQANRAVSVA